MATQVRPRHALRRHALVALGAVSIAAVSFVAPYAPAGASSIGVSPSTLRFENSLRGGTYRASISVFTDSTTPSAFSFDKEGDVAPWLSFFDASDPTETEATTVVAPAKGTDGLIGVKVAVPAPTPNGTYTGTITVYSDLNKGDSSSGPVNVGAQVGVTVAVTGTQVISGTVIDASLATSQIEVGQVARFATTIQNTGNVDMDPDVKVVVRSAGSDVDLLSAAKQPIRPGEIGKLVAAWETQRFGVGDYVATISANSGSVALGDRTVNFRLVPEGSLRREGELRGLEVTTDPTVGGAAKVVAEFANTGEIDADATFRGELRHDGELIGEVTSQTLLVDPGSLGELSFVVQTPEAGEYEITGLVNFSGKETSRRTLTFRAGDAGSGGLAAAIIVGIVGASIVGVALVLLRRRPGSPTVDGPPPRSRVEATV